MSEVYSFWNREIVAATDKAIILQWCEFTFPLLHTLDQSHVQVVEREQQWMKPCSCSPMHALLTWTEVSACKAVNGNSIQQMKSCSHYNWYRINSNLISACFGLIYKHLCQLHNKTKKLYSKISVFIDSYLILQFLSFAHSCTTKTLQGQNILQPSWYLFCYVPAEDQFAFTAWAEYMYVYICGISH